MIKGKEETKINAITDANLEGLNFNPAWRIQNYGSRFQKPTYRIVTLQLLQRTTTIILEKIGTAGHYRTFLKFNVSSN
jgi:hypothetical protein